MGREIGPQKNLRERGGGEGGYRYLWAFGEKENLHMGVAQN